MTASPSRRARALALMVRALELLDDDDRAALDRVLALGLSADAEEQGRRRRGRDGGAADRLDRSLAIALTREIRRFHAQERRISCSRPRELLTIPVAASRAGAKVRTVRDWVARGELVPVGRYGKRDLTTAEDVAAVARGKTR